MPSSHTKSVLSQPRPYERWHGLLGDALAFSRTLEREMDGALAIVRLTAAGFVVLLALDREAPPTQEALARALSLRAAAVSDQLRRLERASLVRRNPARRGGAHPGLGAALPAVARAAACPTATLTERGATVLARAEVIAVRVERAWARRLAAGGPDPTSVGRTVGLRRWLTESRLAVTGAEAQAHHRRPAGGPRR
jgi:hypothetical protein